MAAASQFFPMLTSRNNSPSNNETFAAEVGRDKAGVCYLVSKLLRCCGQRGNIEPGLLLNQSFCQPQSDETQKKKRGFQPSYDRRELQGCKDYLSSLQILFHYICSDHIISSYPSFSICLSVYLYIYLSAVSVCLCMYRCG